MASIKLVYGSTTETCWSSTSKITTPSLILNDNGTTRYTPLFSGSAGGYGYSGNYRYTLGHLIVGGNRVALSQQQYKFANSVRARAHQNVGYTQAYSYQDSSYPYTKYYKHTYYRYYYITYSSLSTGRGTFGGVECTLNTSIKANADFWTKIKTDSKTATYSDTSNYSNYPTARTTSNGDKLNVSWTTSGCTSNSMSLSSSAIPWNTIQGTEWGATLSGTFQLS